MISLKSSERTAGVKRQMQNIPSQANQLRVPDSDIAEKHPIGPTRPQVPIPADTPLHSSLNIMVAIGPVIAEASVAGIHIWG